MASRKVFTFSTNTYSFIYRLLDLCVLLGSFPIAAWLYGLTIDREYIIASLVVSVAFLYIAESFALYRSWRVGHFSEMVLNVWACISVAFFLAVIYA